MSQLTIDSVRAELEPLGLSCNKVSGGDYRVAPTTGTEREREAKAYYADSLEDALETGKRMAKGVIEPASIPCGVTVEDVRALSTDPKQEYQLRRVSDGVVGKIVYKTLGSAQLNADDYMRDFGMECEVIPYEPRDFEETPREALVAFARKIAALPINDAAEVNPSVIEGRLLTLEARALASMRKS